MIQVSMFKVRQGNQAYLKVDNGSASENDDILCFGAALREKRVSKAQNGVKFVKIRGYLLIKSVANASAGAFT